MNYKELIKQAPDHNSDDFIVFLMNNNKVVKLLDRWLIVENCKYHNEERTWWTAFFLSYFPDSASQYEIEESHKELMEFLPDGMAIFQNPKDKRTIERTHYHITPMQAPGK